MMAMEKDQLREKIRNSLLEIQGNTLFANLVRSMAKYKPNFENLITIIYNDYQENLDGVRSNIDEVTMRLILKYLNKD